MWTATGTDELLVETFPGSGVLSNDYPGGEGSYEAYGYYRYGFNGKENDNDVKGTGNQQDYGMRIYDPRLGRFLSVDPLTKAYPWYTPYQFAGNSPILFIDLDGGEPKKGDPNYGQNLILGRVNHISLSNGYLKRSNTPTPFARDNQNWLSFPNSASDFVSTANALFQFKDQNPNVKIKNIVLSAHGGRIFFQGSFVEAGLRFNGDQNDKTKYITASEIETYNKNPLELNEDDKEAISNLSGIINAIENKGNLIIKGCHAHANLAQAIQSLAVDGKGINVYFTEDLTTSSDNLDTRLISENETTYSADKRAYIHNRSSSDFKNGFSVLRSSDSKQDRLRKNIILNSQGTPFSVVPESKLKAPKK